MHSLNLFKNKNILITGGTSGLGRALALQLSRLGAQVAVVARRSDPLQQLINERPSITGIQADVANKETIYSIAGEVQAKLGDIDILLNVASYLGQTPLRLLVDTDCEDIEQALQTNLLGPFRLTKALLPAMLLRGAGVVVNISSDAAINAYPRWGGYAISKAAMDHMTRIFSAELSSQGIQFLALDPGDMRTPMHFAAIPEADPEALRDPEDSATRLLQLLAAQDFTQVRRAL